MVIFHSYVSLPEGIWTVYAFDCAWPAKRTSEMGISPTMVWFFWSIGNPCRYDQLQLEGNNTTLLQNSDYESGIVWREAQAASAVTIELPKSDEICQGWSHDWSGSTGSIWFLSSTNMTNFSEGKKPQKLLRSHLIAKSPLRWSLPCKKSGGCTDTLSACSHLTYFFDAKYIKNSSLMFSHYTGSIFRPRRTSTSKIWSFLHDQTCAAPGQR